MAIDLGEGRRGRWDQHVSLALHRGVRRGVHLVGSGRGRECIRRTSGLPKRHQRDSRRAPGRARHLVRRQPGHGRVGSLRCRLRQPPRNLVHLGGTSVASPSVAAMVNGAGRFASSSASELTTVYANLGTAKFNDIKQPHGLCGPYAGFLPQVGWDFCTGVGSPHGLSGL
jgi:hypothetical protein